MDRMDPNTEGEDDNTYIAKLKEWMASAFSVVYPEAKTIASITTKSDIQNWK